PAPDREESFVFDRQGRHLRTLHSQTGAELLSFAYDGTGQLASITDAHGLVTTIERAGDGAPTAIVAPYGQRTDLSLNGEGLLDGITRPGGQSYSIAYREGALLTEFQ